MKLPAEERPLFHLTPLVGWMNDPNGFCYYQGSIICSISIIPFPGSGAPCTGAMP